MQSDDDALVTRIRSGERDALGLLYDRHIDSAYALAHRILGTREAAEDVVHETFLAVWQKIGHYEPTRGRVRAWILAAVRNRAIDRLRTRRVSIDPDQADELALLRTTANPTLDEVVGRLSRDRLRDAIAELPDDQREVIDLAYFRGHTYRDIASIIGVPLGTSNGRMRRALSRLRHALIDTEAAPAAVEVEDPVARPVADR